MSSVLPSLMVSISISLAVGLADGFAGAHFVKPLPAVPTMDAAPTEAAAQEANSSEGAAGPGVVASIARIQADAAIGPVPLPSADAPVLATMEALAERGRAGDARAARRLADDLSACAELERDLRIAERMIDGRGRRRGNALPQDEDQEAVRLDMIDRRLSQLQNTERRCAGISAEQTLSAGEWVRLAAIHGDAEARLCYALAPNEWNRSLMTPQWLEWSTRWQAEAPSQLKLALEAGVPEAAAAMSQMYTPWSPQDGRPWDGALGDDAYWAYAYALIAQNVLEGSAAARWADIARQHSLRLASAQIAAAQSWAAKAQAQIAFMAPVAAPQRDASLCSRIRAVGGR